MHYHSSDDNLWNNNTILMSVTISTVVPMSLMVHDELTR